MSKKSPRPAKGTRKALKTGTESLAPLTQFDWDFGKVQDGELIACLHYEYARESPAIVAHYDEGKSQPCFPSGLFYCAVMNERLVKLPTPFKWPWPSSQAVRFAETPWQTLTDNYRRQVAESYSRTFWNRFRYPAFCRADSQFVPPEFMSRGNERKGIYPETGIERMAVEIDWAGFDNAEIVETFRTWVEASRPSSRNRKEWQMFMPYRSVKDIGWNNRQGHDELKKCRNSLDRLGIFRLRRRFTLEKMQAEIYDAWSDDAGATRSSANKYTNLSECNREFYNAIQDFHNLFPFLPGQELPFSLRPKRTPRIRPTEKDQPYIREYRYLG